MTIAELIELLNQYPSDSTVEIQFRDGGGEYYGSEEPYLKWDESEKMLLL